VRFSEKKNVKRISANQQHKWHHQLKKYGSQNRNTRDQFHGKCRSHEIVN